MLSSMLGLPDKKRAYNNTEMLPALLEPTLTRKPFGFSASLILVSAVQHFTSSESCVNLQHMNSDPKVESSEKGTPFGQHNNHLSFSKIHRTHRFLNTHIKELNISLTYIWKAAGKDWFNSSLCLWHLAVLSYLNMMSSETPILAFSDIWFRVIAFYEKHLYLLLEWRCELLEITLEKSWTGPPF